MKKIWVACGVVAACAACCAPLLMSVLTGIGAVTASAAGAGWLAGLSLDAIVCLALPVAALTGLAAWIVRQRRRQQAAACDCETTCPVDS